MINVQDQRIASERQVALLRELASERDIRDEDRERLLTKLAKHRDPEDDYLMPFAEADQSIKWFFQRTRPRPGVVPSHIQAMPKAEHRETTNEERARRDQQPITDRTSAERYIGQVTRTRPSRDPKTLPTSGVFRRDNETYIIVPTRTPGHHIAMRMVPTPNRRTKSGNVVQFDYVKDPGAIWNLYEEHRLPAEAVEELMVEHRMCIYPGCYRVLRAAASVARGAGKVHAKRLGLIP